MLWFPESLATYYSTTVMFKKKMVVRTITVVKKSIRRNNNSNILFKLEGEAVNILGVLLCRAFQ